MKTTGFIDNFCKFSYNRLDGDLHLKILKTKVMLDYLPDYQLSGISNFSLETTEETNKNDHMMKMLRKLLKYSGKQTKKNPVSVYYNLCLPL